MACRHPQAPAPRDIPYKQRGLFLQKNLEFKAHETVKSLSALNIGCLFCFALQPIPRITDNRTTHPASIAFGASPDSN
jgi:hypothetical protein